MTLAAHIIWALVAMSTLGAGVYIAMLVTARAAKSEDEKREQLARQLQASMEELVLSLTTRVDGIDDKLRSLAEKTDPALVSRSAVGRR